MPELNIQLMRILLFFILTLSGLTCSAQQYECRFKIDQVEAYTVAKPLVSIIRNKYRTAEEPKAVMVTFKEEEQSFQVLSVMPLGEMELTALMQQHGYVLREFEKIVVNETDPAR